MACLCLFSFWFCSVMAINSFANVGRSESAQDMISETLSCGCVCSSYQLLPVTVQRQGFGSEWGGGGGFSGEHMVPPPPPPPPLPSSLPPSLHPSTFSLAAKRITALYRIPFSGLGTSISRRCAPRGADAESWQTEAQRATVFARARDGRFFFFETKRLKRRIIIVKNKR